MGAQFRHANSPDEVAKREARDPAAVKDPVKGFRHYNHPEEVAKRERNAPPPLPPQQQRGAASALPPVVPTPSAPAVGVVAPVAASVVIPGPPRGTNALLRLAALESAFADLEQRFEERVDQALADLFGTPEELQALRVTLHNMPAVEEQALNLRNRVKALEDTLDANFVASTTEGPEAEELTQPDTVPPHADPSAEG
jgi:hypothetical protein